MSKQRWQDWVTTVAGLYVFFSPWIIPYFFPSATVAGMGAWALHILGAAIAAIGVAALASYRLWEEWAELALGVALILAPWFFQFSGVTAFTWSSIVVGVVVVLMAVIALTPANMAAQRGH